MKVFYDLMRVMSVQANGVLPGKMGRGEKDKDTSANTAT